MRLRKNNDWGLWTLLLEIFAILNGAIAVYYQIVGSYPQATHHLVAFFGLILIVMVANIPTE